MSHDHLNMDAAARCVCVCLCEYVPAWHGFSTAWAMLGICQQLANPAGFVVVKTHC